MRCGLFVLPFAMWSLQMAPERRDHQLMAPILKEMALMRLQYEGVLFMFGSVSGFLLELVSSDFPLPPRWPQAGSQEFEKIVACVLELGGQTCQPLGGVRFNGAQHLAKASACNR